MSDLALASILSGVVLLASTISIELGLASAIIEMIFGVIVGNVFHITVLPDWLTFIASFGSILLTFLAGTEVNIDIMKSKLKESLLIGGLSFLLPFAIVLAFTYYIDHWTLNAAKIAAVALSTTSLAVVYAVLVETGLNKTELGKLIMSATFVTDFGTAIALSLLFIQITPYTVLFFVLAIVLLFFGPKMIKYFFEKYSNRVIEPEIKLLFFIFFLTMFLGELGKSHAVLPIFVLGLLMSRFFEKNSIYIKKLRTVGYVIITPFFFIKGGMSVGFKEVLSSLNLVGIFLLLKLGAKIIGVYPISRMTMPSGGRIFTTLLMSTGLTFGTLSTVYGFQAGFIDKSQFSILLAVVILSAVVPTIIAQRFFSQVSPENKELLLEEGEEG